MLYKTFNSIKEAFGPDYFTSRIDDEIVQNLNPKFGLREYQKEALGRFDFYFNGYQKRQFPVQLLFHMATGSGKTLIMAGTILYLYEQGYRNFIFFVNSTNIINKTRDNFLNPLSSKYLFSENITFGKKQVRIKEVENFQAVNQEDINIVFSTIQALHIRLNTPRENSITYDDFSDKKIVLLSDEAHHINAETKKGKDLTKEEREEIISWEGTVSRIFRANPDNILLEFTATANLSNQDILKKYSDKLLFDYPLKQFRIDGYSKEVKVLQADIPQIERGLQSLILSQYRRKIFEKYKKIIKPVILFKSKTINESKIFFESFVDTIKNLKTEDVQKINERDNDRAIKKAFKYFEDNNIALENLISEIKEDFSLEKCIEINSKEESEEKQIAVNTLEDETNEYRAVFAVDKLNEGWDVLNLFDIVRLYNTRDAMDGKPGRTTMAEAQLIGRGARYCPFQIEETQPMYQRKYDDDIEHELRICEELYYHSAYNPRYIQELNTALQEIGIKAKESREIQLELKLDFKESELYKNGFIFLNEQRKYDRSNISTLPVSTEQRHKVRLRTGITKSSILFESVEQESIDIKQKDYHLTDFGQNILRKTINKLEFYQFNNLKSFLPNLESISEFITSENYLGKVKVEIEGKANQIENLTPQQKLDIAIEVLEKVSPVIISDKVEFEGTPEFKPYEINKTFKDKTLNIYVREGKDQEYGVGQKKTTNPDLNLDLSNKEWYAFNDNYGTSEEKHLIKFINKTYDKLKTKYSKIYLVRNEKYFQLYNFDDGRAIEPDFVLFLEKKETGQSLHYQIFIEPKGDYLLKEDEWKERFLKSLKEKAEMQIFWKTKKYVIWGMPFYNEQVRKNEFEKEFEKIVCDFV